MEKWQMALIMGILASLIAYFIIKAISDLFVKKSGKKIVSNILGKVLGIEIKNIFKNSEDVVEDLQIELKKAKNIAILTGRGLDLRKGPKFQEIYENSKNKDSIRILLPRTIFTSDETDWTAHRQSELETASKAYRGNLKNDILETQNSIINHDTSKKIKIKCFNTPHIGRIVITERVAYFTPYETNKDGLESRIFKYGTNDDMYNALTRLFDVIWEYEKCPEGLDCTAACKRTF